MYGQIRTAVLAFGLIAMGVGAAQADTAAGDWNATFAPAIVVGYHRPASVAVLAVDKPGRLGDETRTAAAALTAAYRAAGVTIGDAASLGAIADGDDAAIVGRARALRVARVAIVRAFLEGTAARAIVTLYDAEGQLVTGFSAVAGEALPAAPSQPGDSVADQIMRSAATPAEPSLDKDGMVRLWIKQSDPTLQLLRTDAAPFTAGNRHGTVVSSGIVCRAPCGVVVDGSLGQPFTFGQMGSPRTQQFALTGYKGDVTADVKLGRPGMLFGGFTLMSMGFGGVVAGGTGLAVGFDDFDTFNKVSLVGGAVTMLVGYLLYDAGKPAVTLTRGRPR